jgi:hypothetical protein
VGVVDHVNTSFGHGVDCVNSISISVQHVSLLINIIVLGF